MVDYYLRKRGSDLEDTVLCGIVFESNETETSQTKLRVKLRFKSSPTHQMGDGPPFTSWFTDFTFPQFSIPGPRELDYKTGAQPGYYEEGFLTIQHLVTMAVANVTSNGLTKAQENELNLTAQRFPYPPFIKDLFLVALQFLFPVILMFSFIYPAVNQTKNLVLEKEKRLKESMKMMGLKDWLHWFAWFLKSLLWLAISVAIITIFLCVKIKDGVGILNSSDWSLVYFFFIMYSITTISFCFMLSTIFSKVRLQSLP
jgi:ATP-binding cassette subfamily A (ABC1) protein 3